MHPRTMRVHKEARASRPIQQTKAVTVVVHHRKAAKVLTGLRAAGRQVDQEGCPSSPQPDQVTFLADGWAGAMKRRGKCLPRTKDQLVSRRPMGSLAWADRRARRRGTVACTKKPV
jgi:hypothetical protein